MRVALHGRELVSVLDPVWLREVVDVTQIVFTLAIINNTVAKRFRKRVKSVMKRGGALW